jgi:hypothetical protein
MKTYIYFHICCINNWPIIVANLHNDIKNSGLYDVVDEIRCGVLGEYDPNYEFFNDAKVKIVAHSLDKNIYETLTINKIHEDSQHEDFFCLYIHSKGVRYDGSNPNIEQWVSFLTYFNVYKYKDCFNELNQGADCVGVKLNHEPTLHYSGNFWWSRSSYITPLRIQNARFAGSYEWHGTVTLRI